MSNATTITADDITNESLIAETLNDIYVVTDSDGGMWWPSDEAHAEIVAAADPEAKAIEICVAEPMRGSWSD